MVDAQINMIKQEQELSNLEIKQQFEKQQFVNGNPEAVNSIESIEAIMEEHPTLDYESAYRFHLVQTDPSKLLDAQKRAQIEDNKQAITGATPKELYTQK